MPAAEFSVTMHGSVPAPVMDPALHARPLIRTRFVPELVSPGFTPPEPQPDKVRQMNRLINEP